MLSVFFLFLSLCLSEWPGKSRWATNVPTNGQVLILLLAGHGDRECTPLVPVAIIPAAGPAWGDHSSGRPISPFLFDHAWFLRSDSGATLAISRGW